MATRYKWDNSGVPKQSSGWSGSDSLGTKIEKMLVRMGQAMFLWCFEFVSDRLVDIFDNSMKILQPGVDRAAKGLFKDLKEMEGVPDWFRQAMASAESETGESGFFLRILTWYVGVRSIIFGGLAPAQRWADYNADKTLRSFLPDPATLAFMRRIGIMSQEGYIDAMQKLGLHDKLIPLYDELSRNMPTSGELMAGLWRGVYTESQYKELLKRTGADPKDVDLYMELTKNVPPLSDLLLMMRREAFDENISNKYGYEEDYPAAIEPFFKQNGYDPKFAKLYYRAGWTVPSPSMGYEMLHRGLIDETVLDDVLKIADYPPYWREKLMKLSYANYTRVDIRRMYQAGVLNEGEVLEAYKQIGYPPDRAQKLTDFTTAQVSQEEKDLTKTDVLNLYEEGVIDRGTTGDNLVKMGYDSDEAEAILKLSDVSIAKAARTDLINYVKERFLANMIEEGQARTELTAMGLKVQSVDRYVMNWQRSTEVEAAIPSLADTRRWYKNDLIDEQEFRKYLKLLRHTVKNIDLYVKEVNDAKAKEEEEPAPETAPSTFAEAAIPTVATIKGWYIENVIDETQARAYLTLRNYATPDINLFITQWNIEKAA